jgi:hypothetical protein
MPAPRLDDDTGSSMAAIKPTAGSPEQRDDLIDLFGRRSDTSRRGTDLAFSSTVGGFVH